MGRKQLGLTQQDMGALRGPRRKGLISWILKLVANPGREKATFTLLPGSRLLTPTSVGTSLPSGVGALGPVHSCLPPSQPVPPASHRDEDLQLQLALRLSRQEHEKVAAEPPVLVQV